MSDTDATDEEVRQALRGLADGTAPPLGGPTTAASPGDGPGRPAGPPSGGTAGRDARCGLSDGAPVPRDGDAVADLLASVERAAEALSAGGERRLRTRAREGPATDRRAARTALRSLRRYRRAARGRLPEREEVDAADRSRRAERF